MLHTIKYDVYTLFFGLDFLSVISVHGIKLSHTPRGRLSMMMSLQVILYGALDWSLSMFSSMHMHSEGNQLVGGSLVHNSFFWTPSITNILMYLN